MSANAFVNQPDPHNLYSFYEKHAPAIQQAMQSANPNLPEDQIKLQSQAAIIETFRVASRMCCYAARNVSPVVFLGVVGFSIIAVASLVLAVAKTIDLKNVMYFSGGAAAISGMTNLYMLAHINSKAHEFMRNQFNHDYSLNPQAPGSKHVFASAGAALGEKLNPSTSGPAP